MTEKKLFITGAKGFVGENLCLELERRGYNFLPSARKVNMTENYHLRNALECDLAKPFDLIETLQNCHTVIHCAGRAHVMNSADGKKEIAKFDKINHLVTDSLAKQAVKAGVRRFILISTAGVMGKSSLSGFPINLDNRINPEDHYALSKLKGEEALKLLSEQSKMSFTVLRPPLIYGKNAPGNWRRLIKLLEYNIPLPLANIENKRSFIFIGNFVDLIIKCIDDDRAKNKTFLASDNQDISTSRLVELLLKSENRSTRMFYLNKNLLMLLSQIIGKRSTLEQLYGNLQLDISETVKQLEWQPKFKLEEAIRLSKRDEK